MNHIMQLIAPIAIFLFFSCSSDNKPSQGIDLSNTTWQRLSNENIKIKLPTDLKPSSKYRLKEDLPLIGKDSVKLRIAQKSLELLEFEDSEVDVYVDTSKTYRLIIVCNIERVDFNKSDAAILKKKIELSNAEKSATVFGIEYGQVVVRMKGNKNFKMIRYTTPISNVFDETLIYNSVFYLTGKSYTLIVYEFSMDQESIEKYLWTTVSG